MSDVVSQVEGGRARVAAIYARVSSERQRQDETIHSQTVGLRELAATRGLLGPRGLGVRGRGVLGRDADPPGARAAARPSGGGSVRGAALPRARPARAPLRLPGAAARGARARRRGGRASRRSPSGAGSPEDELLRQFQGMIAEYERAQIRRAHPPREAAPRPRRLAGGAVRRALRIPVRQESRAL